MYPQKTQTQQMSWESSLPVFRVGEAIAHRLTCWGQQTLPRNQGDKRRVLGRGHNLWSEYTEPGLFQGGVGSYHELSDWNESISGADRSSQRAQCDPQLFQPIPSAEQRILGVCLPNLSTLWESCWPQQLRQPTKLMLLTMAGTLHF